jgi:hypothetical protein
MRGIRLIGCALAVAALFLVSNARADEYTKLTYLTFSGPVQLPGVTLPGGTYMFKLADPDTGRRVIQVWDKDGMKLYTTLLTIPDQRMEASDKPAVMFSERPSGQAQAIKSWFYPDERTGYEFVYPKGQATQIAKENHASVLSYTDDSAKANDAASMKSAKIGRIDENGQPVDDSKAAENHANDNAAQSSTAARNDDAASKPATTSPSASSTTAPAAATTAADNDNAASSTTTRAGATTARADNSQNNAAPAPSANRTQSSPAAGASASTAQSSTAPQSNTARNDTAQSNTASRPNRAVGTSGTTANPQRSNNRNANANNSNRANQSDRGANAGSSNRTLPKTASPLTSLELLSALSLLGGLGVHQLRKRAHSRSQPDVTLDWPVHAVVQRGRAIGA